MPEDTSYSTFFLGDYIIAYDPTIQTKTYVCQDFYSISFFIDDFEYCLVHNYIMGDRIVISNKDGYCKDIPFKVDTFGFLPDKINAREK